MTRTNVSFLAGMFNFDALTNTHISIKLGTFHIETADKKAFSRTGSVRDANYRSTRVFHQGS